MKEYVRLVSEITGNDPDSTLARMKMVKKTFGISYKEYYNNGMYNMSEGMLEKEALRLRKRKEKRREAFDAIIKNSSMTKDRIIAEIKRINEKEIKHINVLFYERFQMYSMSEEELETTLELLNKRDELCKEIKDDFKSIDAGRMTYSDIDQKIAELKAIIKTLLKPDFIDKLRNMYAKGRDCTNDIVLDDVFVDMDATRLLLEFSFKEYLAFHFEDKTFEEKREYMNNKERMEVLRQYNDEAGCDMLDDKAKCYKVLKKQFGRKQILISNKNDAFRFKCFCFGRKAFVKKALARSMGKGIELVNLDGKTDIRKIMMSFLDESGPFVAEELIRQHDTMKAFNETSVNTVRLETFFDGKEVRIMDSFMKTGQNGSFVDNGGAGGIFAAVDPDSGILLGDGIDEFGKIYITHPQSGTRYKGHKLEDWDKALALVKSVGSKFAGVSIIGWDLAYTDKGKWIIVEGNAKPQIIGNQATQTKGLKKEFLKKTKYSEK